VALDHVEDVADQADVGDAERRHPRPLLVPAAARGARPAGAHRAATTSARAADGALAGSVLSAATWRQALAAATGKAS
jgi:flagellar protein FliO/FliZ